METWNGKDIRTYLHTELEKIDIREDWKTDIQQKYHPSCLRNVSMGTPRAQLGLESCPTCLILGKDPD